jgi:hypothetical protein
MRKVLLLVLMMSGVLALGACNGGTPQIELELTVMDLGEVVNGEIVSRDVSVRNVGEAPLIVDSVSTSCGCTSATLTPMTIAPGATANLHIELDSGAHGPELTGTLVRQVFINSNAPDQPEAQVELTVNILKRP